MLLLHLIFSTRHCEERGNLKPYLFEIASVKTLVMTIQRIIK